MYTHYPNVCRTAFSPNFFKPLYTGHGFFKRNPAAFSHLFYASDTYDENSENFILIIRGIRVQCVMDPTRGPDAVIWCGLASLDPNNPNSVFLQRIL